MKGPDWKKYGKEWGPTIGLLLYMLMFAWLVPHELMPRCYIPWYAASGYPPPSDCTFLNQITGTLSGTVGLLLPFAFLLAIYLGIAGLVRRFRAPPR